MSTISPYAEPLPSPTFPNAIDGGLGYDDLQRNPSAQVVAIVPQWDGYEDGDTLTILWGAGLQQVGSTQASSSDKYKALNVFIPATAIVNLGAGEHPVLARVNRTIGQPVDSLPITVVVKLTVPGGHDPDPHTPYANENLAPPTVVPEDIGADKRALVTVPPYDNMAVGDIITVQWNADGNNVVHPPLTNAELNRPVVFDIDSDTIEAGGVGDRLIVAYQVYDIVKNWSLWSPHALVNVPDPNAPPPPWVMGTVGDRGLTLDVDALGTADLQVLVEGSGVQAGEPVVVHWSGTTAAGGPVVFDTAPITASRNDQTLQFTVPNAYVSPLAQGTARASYTIQSLVGLPRNSARRNLQVIGQAVRLLQPGIQEAVGRTLDPADVPASGAHALVPPWAGMQEGDRLDLVLEGKASSGAPTRWSDGIPISRNMVGLAVPFSIPRAEIDVLINGSLSLYYLVQPFGTARESGTRIKRAVRFATLRSDALDLDVRTSIPQPLLDAPTLREAVNGVLDPDLFPAPHIDIPSYGGIATGDRVSVALRGGVTPHDDSTLVSNPSIPPTFIVPARVISDNRNQTLTASYTVARVAGGVDSSLGETFRIGAVSASLPAPTVDQAVGGSLDPLAAANGITVRIPSTVSISPNDHVAVVVSGAGGGSTTTPQTGNPNGMAFSVGPAVIAKNLGRPVDVYYTVTPIAGGLPRTSPLLSLNVLNIPVGDSRVARPVIVEANGSLTLQLANFTGDATVEVIRWPLMASGQRYWLRAFSGASSITLASGQLVSAPGNLRHALLRSWLTALGNLSSVILELKIAFDGGSEATAITFNSPGYTIVRSSWDVEFDFDSEPIREIAWGQTLRFPQNSDTLMNVQFDPQVVVPKDDRIGVERYPFPESGYFKGRNLFIGAPEFSIHDRYVFFNFNETWDIVSFVVTSVHETVTISFKDSALHVISPIIAIQPTGPDRQHVVEYNDAGRRRIRHVELRARDVIRLDAFKFRR